jgi:phosphoribosyl-ATP pyrophosphohydrolase
MSRQVVSDHWKVRALIEHLHNIDDRISDDFKNRRGRKPELADKVKKIIEEVGEVIHANAKKAGTYSVAEEVWDSAFAAIAQGFNLGLTNEEMMKGLNDCLEKLQYRWIPQGFSQ